MFVPLARVALFTIAMLGAPSLRAQVPQVPLTGTVTDEQGKPVTDAIVEVFRGEGRGFVCLDLQLAHSWRPLQRVPVDKRGRFGLQVPAGLVLRVQVVHAGHARWRRDDLTPGDELPIVLTAPCTLRGQLRLQGKGTPGRLRAWNRLHTELFDVRTDAEGKFEFADLPAGAFTCDVTPDVAMAPDWWQAALDASAPLERTFDLEPGKVLQGLVTDAATGLPIVGARIGENWTLDKAVATDADGRYELRGYGQAGAPDVECAALGYLRSVHGKLDQPGSPLQLDFALQPGGAITGTVVDAAGRPRAGVYVAAIAIHGGEGGGLQWLPARTDERGAFAIQGVRPGAGSSLMLRCDGFASCVFTLPLVKPDAPLELGALRLEPANCVRGTLVDGGGQPIANAEVELVGTNADRGRLTTLPAVAFDDYSIAVRTARTDAHGNFAFGDVPVGSFGIGEAATPQQPNPARSSVDVVAGKPTELVRLTR